MTWTLDPDIDVERLRHWEATLDQLVAHDLPVRISCQYSRGRLPSRVVDAGLATHQHAVVKSRVRMNPFYAVESILNGSFDDRATDARTLDSMLGVLGCAARDDGALAAS
jgi:hypothetical protein